MRQILYIVVQLTWGLLQSLAGLSVLITQSRPPHRLYHGAVVTFWPSQFSLALGMFIFLGTDAAAAETASALRNPKSRMARLLVHEYGHTVQSLALGPIFLFVVGIPSFIWARSRKMAARRQHVGTSYYAFYTERWANAWGERALHRPSMRG